MEEKYLNKNLSPEERAADLITRMDIKEKMAQIAGYQWIPWGNNDIAQACPEGIGQIACIGMMMLPDVKSFMAKQRELQDAVIAAGKHHIPAIFHMEGLTGCLYKEATVFPSGIGQASTWDPDLQYKVGSIIGKQARAVGATQVFAPVLDISRDARIGRMGESYGEDPTLASMMGCAYINGLQGDGDLAVHPMAVAKHFAGFHDAQGGITAANCDIPQRLLKEVYIKPFWAAIEGADLHAVMPCYSSVNGEPVTGSKTFIRQLLREEMGFDGVVVSDYTAVAELHKRHKIAPDTGTAGLIALSAGVDVELPNRECYNEQLGEMFSESKAAMQLLDEAVYHHLVAKFRLGLFENPYHWEEHQVLELLENLENRDVALQAARESMVLIKNNGILPIKNREQKILVVGWHASAVISLFGGYTWPSFNEGLFGSEISMAGIGELENLMPAGNREIATYAGTCVEKYHPQVENGIKSAKPGLRNLLEQLKEKCQDCEITYAQGFDYAGTDMHLHEEALHAAEAADLVIVTVGGKYGTDTTATTGEGIDASDINLPLCQEIFLEKLGGLGIPFIAVHFDGRAISSDAADKYAGAIIEAWSPGQEGAQAVVEILFGEYNPGGKMPVTTAYAAGQMPLYYNHPNGSSYHHNTGNAFQQYMDLTHEPRYYFGHGLSYTSFRYTGLRIEKNEKQEHLRIMLDVENTGEMDGDEVVQLYSSDCFACCVRPNMELIGFKRLHLKKGERKKIIFSLKFSQLSYLNMDMEWCLEKGEIDIQVGSSSKDIRLKQTIMIEENHLFDHRIREFYAKAIVE